MSNTLEEILKLPIEEKREAFRNFLELIEIDIFTELNNVLEELEIEEDMRFEIISRYGKVLLNQLRKDK